jgi:hypothetical protein
MQEQQVNNDITLRKMIASKLAKQLHKDIDSIITKHPDYEIVSLVVPDEATNQVLGPTLYDQYKCVLRPDENDDICEEDTYVYTIYKTKEGHQVSDITKMPENDYDEYIEFINSKIAEIPNSLIRGILVRPEVYEKLQRYCENRHIGLGYSVDDSTCCEYMGVSIQSGDYIANVTIELHQLGML